MVVGKNDTLTKRHGFFGGSIKNLKTFSNKTFEVATNASVRHINLIEYYYCIMQNMMVWLFHVFINISG